MFSPHVAKLDLWKTSGHFDFYKENMYDQMKVCVRSSCCVTLPNLQLNPWRATRIQY